MILVACEESQRVCAAFRARGQEAYSCDLVKTSGTHPEWHIQGDALNLLNGRCSFHTQDGKIHVLLGEWDMIIAFPPCTYLCNAGARWFDQRRKEGKQKMAAAFFMRLVNAKCDHIAIENPVGLMSTFYRKADQIVQPWQFGERYAKRTCLWLKGLPKLRPTDIVGHGDYSFCGKDRKKRIPKWYANFTKKNRSVERSKTPLGLALAMADQWDFALCGEDD